MFDFGVGITAGDTAPQQKGRQRVRSQTLTQRLAARAFALALDAELSTADQVVHLARLAAGDPGALDLAVRIIEAWPERSSPLAVQAVTALKAAAAIASVPPELSTSPLGTVA